MALFRLFYGRVSSKDQNLELQLAQAREFDFDRVFAERITGRRADRPSFWLWLPPPWSYASKGTRSNAG